MRSAVLNILKMSKLWNNENELFTLARNELYTAVVGDIMDQMGFTEQFLPPRLQPLQKDMIVTGKAMTVLEADVWPLEYASDHNSLMDRPFGLMLEALDDLRENEVYLCSGATPPTPCGEKS